MDNGTIAFLVRETGWSLEYIRAQSVSLLTALLGELYYQKALEDYRQDCRVASLMATMARLWGNKRVSTEDIVGMPPERRNMVEEKILAKGKQPQKIMLADGQEYELAPVTLNLLMQVEDKFDKSYFDLFNSRRFSHLRFILLLRLRGKHPELTEENVGELVTMDTLTNIDLIYGVE